MKNLTISLENHPGTLAQVGEVLGKVGVSIEGGGMRVVSANTYNEFVTALRIRRDTVWLRHQLSLD